jgi:hypothetical protein
MFICHYEWSDVAHQTFTGSLSVCIDLQVCRYFEELIAVVAIVIFFPSTCFILHVIQ